MQMKFRNGVYSMTVQATSYTYLFDRERTNRSFQNLSTTYYKLFREMTDSYPHGDFIDLIDADRTVDEFTVQYQESDWEFLRRMASRLQTGLIAEVTSELPRFWLGSSRDQIKGELKSINYSIRRTKSGPKYTYVEIEDTKRFSVGDVVIFQHKHWAIDQVTAQMKQGLLKYTYMLVAEGGLPRDTVYNDHLIGVSINGKVIDRANESVRLQLAMDHQPMKEDSCWFAYPTMYTAEGIGWQCMPELGDTVQLYFPSRQEKAAYVIHSLRQKNNKSDEVKEPERKLFHTKTGKIARFDDKETALSTQAEKLMIRLNPATGIHVYSHHDLTFEAKEDLVLHGKKVQITATHELELSCKNSYMRADGEFHLKASKLLSDQVPDTELRAYNSLMKELEGKGYSQWVQNLLLKYKSQYYKALDAGDKKGCKEATAKAKQIRQQVAEIDAMPAWARAQMHEYTAQWWDAHASGDKSRQNKIHSLANKLRENLLINELIRGSTATSYLDANRLEELSAQYADAAHKLTVADKQAIAKEAAALRSKYGVGNLQARENMNKLARKYPDSFPYKLPLQGDWDAALNAALYDFAKKYEISNKGYSRDVLEVYLYQVANGILPWPKVTQKKPSASTPTPQVAIPPKSGSNGTTPAKPPVEKEEPVDNTDHKDGLVAVKKIEQYIKDKGIKGKQATALYRVNEYTNNSIIKNKLSVNSSTPLVFFFEGDGSYSLPQTDHPEGRYGAMVIVVVNGEVKYTSKNASTLPDYESKDKTVKDGVYEFVGGKHRGTYPALRVRDGGEVPATKGIKKIDCTANGINIHKGYNKDNEDSPTSTGCITVHKDEYVRFLISVGVVKNSLEEAPIRVKGTAIIERKDRN
jgi:hypothetical protein